MTQRVRVLSVLGNTARVIYDRPTACHGDCHHCAGGCGSMATQETLIVEAENRIGAGVGDWVLIEGSTRKVAIAIALVYVLPLVLFFLGYFLGQQFGGYGAGAGIAGFFLGLLTAVLISRKQQKSGAQIRYQVVAYAKK